MLLERGADVNVRSAPLDVPAAAHRTVGAVARELDAADVRGARERARGGPRAASAPRRDLNATDPDGATALVIAIINANYEFAALLLDAGADPNVVDKDAGMGPLYAAVDMHRLAIGHGRPNPRPSGPLDAVDIVRRLLERKADPNAAPQGRHLPAASHDGRRIAGQRARRRSCAPPSRATST